MFPQSSRPFRFGVQGQRATSAADWKEKARKAEALGFDVLLMADHFGPQLSIGPALAIAAEVTTALRIGQLVLQADLYHPAMLAKETATLDVLSAGRMELGLGAGGSYPPDYEWTGISFNSPGARIERLRESIAILKGLFAEEAFTFSGKYFNITNYDGRPKPIQNPHPPILIGAGGKRMLELAAREADILAPLPAMGPKGGDFSEEEMSVASIENKIDFVRRIALDRFDQIELNSLTDVLTVTDNRQAAIESLCKEWGQDSQNWQDSPFLLIGSGEKIVNDIREYRERLGFTYFVVRDFMMDDFAPILAKLK